MKGRLEENTGRYLYEAIPGRVANILLWNLVPIVATTVAVVAPVQGGVWDAAFQEAGKRPVGFDLAGSPFGDDRFDIYPFDPTLAARYRYRDVFTGYIFDRPIDEQFVERGIPGLYDGVEKAVLERSKLIDADTYALTTRMIAESAVKLRSRMYHQTSQALVESSLLAVAGAGFLFAVIAFAARQHRG